MALASRSSLGASSAKSPGVRAGRQAGRAGFALQRRVQPQAISHGQDSHQHKGMFGFGFPFVMSAMVGRRSASETNNPEDHHTVPVTMRSDTGAGHNANGAGYAGTNNIVTLTTPTHASISNHGGNGAGSEALMEYVEHVVADMKATMDALQETRSHFKQVVAERNVALKQRDEEIMRLSQRLQEAERNAHVMESRLQQAERNGARATPSPQAQVMRSRSPSPPPRAVAPPAAPTRSPSPPPRPPTPKPVAEVVLYYRTGWKQAFLHCNADGKGWTQPPGLPLEPSGGDIKLIRVPCSRMEFVLTNGKGDWDSPQGNYQIGGPGTYRLESGRIHKAS